jgi:hypothetical protein
MKKLIKLIKSFYTPPSPEVIALRELEESKRNLLEAQSARDYADSMCKYHESRIKRLTAYLHSCTEDEK